jgi:phosphoserine phosphatase RsbU/P
LSTRQARVAVLDPSGARREVELSTLPFRIGRQADNELPLHDSRISRRQAQIVASGESYLVEDMGSRHGTFVNGQKILSQELRLQDTIDFGVPDSYRLVFLGQQATLEELLERAEAPAQDQTGSRDLHHLGILLEVARTLGSGLSLEEVLATVVDAAIRITATERGILMMALPDGTLYPAVARDAQKGTLSPTQLQVSSSVLKRVASTRRELIISDTEDDHRMQQQASVARLELHTVIAIPVDKLPVIEAADVTITGRRGELLGVLYLDSHKPSTAFSQMDREVLRNLVREAANVIENARLFAASRAKSRLDHEIEIASQIQRQLAPESFPQMSHLAITGSTLACLSVGGDCFDVMDLGEGRLGFFVGDVSGKGISAALLATLLQGILDTTSDMKIPLVEAVAHVNRYLCKRSSAERYATLFFGLLSADGALEFVNCGHVPPLIRRRNGEVENLSAGNMPVGMFPEAAFVPATAQLRPDDFMVVYTDGVSEAANMAQEFFGEERLSEVLRNFQGSTVEELAEAVQQSVRAFARGAPQSDDITLLVAKYIGQ